MSLWVNDFQSLTRVIYHEPTPEVSAKYPFACVFKEADVQESANPDHIAGIFVDFGEGEQYVVCATDDETLVFRVTSACGDVEQERLGVKPIKVEREDVPAQGGLILPGQPQQQTQAAGAIINETYGKAWNCSAMTEVPPETMAKITKLLGKAL
jgi:hypothetical protein